MNRYRARVGTVDRDGNVVGAVHTFTVQASNIRTAANRAMQGFERRSELAVTVRLLERDVVRPRLERGSHGKARAAT